MRTGYMQYAKRALPYFVKSWDVHNWSEYRLNEAKELAQKYHARFLDNVVIRKGVMIAIAPEKVKVN